MLVKYELTRMLRGIKPIQFIIRKLILVLMFIQTSEFTRIFIELAHPHIFVLSPFAFIRVSILQILTPLVNAPHNEVNAQPSR